MNEELTQTPTDTEIRRLIERRDWEKARELLALRPAAEVTDFLLDLERQDRLVVLRLLPRRLSSEVFSYFETEDKNVLLSELSNEETRHLLANLKPDDRTQLLEELPGRATQRLLNLLSPEDLKEARSLLGYPEESVGRLMTPDYVAVRKDWTVEKALEHIRKMGKTSETINVVYVTDPSWKLLDALNLRRLILADPSSKVEDLMDHSFVALSAFDDREVAVGTMQRYDLYALPVVDSDGVLLGIVTADDVMDVAEEEATEDFHKTAAVAPLRSSYRESGVYALFRKRIGWLLALVVVNLASSGVIAAYEEVLASALALAFFIPLLIDSGGNAGAQSATLMVRALATGDIKMTQWWRVLMKELGVGASLGLAMGVAGWALGLVRGGFEIGLVIGLTMFTIVVLANLIGILMPFVLVKMKLDPAVASSPLITSITDASGLLVYFFIAARLLTV